MPEVMEVEEGSVIRVEEEAVAPKKQKLDDNSLNALEEARAILQAKIAGQMPNSKDTADEKVVNAMSLIAEGYQTESEEEGEIEHEDRKKEHQVNTLQEEEIIVQSGSELGEIIEISDVEMELEKAVESYAPYKAAERSRRGSPLQKRNESLRHRSPPYGSREHYGHCDRFSREKENRSPPPYHRSRTGSPPHYRSRTRSPPHHRNAVRSPPRHRSRTRSPPHQRSRTGSPHWPRERTQGSDDFHSRPGYKSPSYGERDK